MTNLDLTRTTMVGRRRVYLVKVARCQRTLILLVLAYLCTSAATIIVPRLLVAPSLAPFLGIAGGVAMLVIVITSIITIIRLAHASGRGVVTAVLIGLAMFIPLVGLIVLIIVNTRATALLKDHGVHVGFLGVTRDEMRKLMLHACPSCGYDIRNLPAPTCPECGHHLSQEIINAARQPA